VIEFELALAFAGTATSSGYGRSSWSTPATPRADDRPDREPHQTTPAKLMHRLQLVESFGLDHDGVDYVLEAILDEIEHLVDLQRTIMLVRIGDQLTPCRTRTQ
jgi:hypothetical protein